MLSEKFNCPVCGANLPSQKVKSKEALMYFLAGKDRNHVSLNNCITVHTAICSNCGYVMLFDSEKM